MTFTARSALVTVSFEAIVLEWYKDSKGIGTWGIGVTNASGHNVDQYKDKPQSVEKCLAVFLSLVREKYLPPVVKAFAPIVLTENQLAAALSFEYNTGAILSTNWAPLFIEGRPLASRVFLENHYTNGGQLTARREIEAKLFFEDIWPDANIATIYPVLKPSYTPDFHHPQHQDISAAMAQAITA